MRKIEANKEEIIKYESTCWTTPRWPSSPTASPALRQDGGRGGAGEGIKAGLFRPLTLWPFPDEQVAELSGHVKTIIVPEMNLGQIMHEVDRCGGPVQLEGIFRVDGEPISPAQILDKSRRSSNMAFDYDKYLRGGKFPHIWCPGCGDGIVLKSILRAVDR